ncbi:MAG TPA: hypothetical protein VF759_02700 [Allosphingosinicella sp.]|jgi:hypothetical protein
MSTGTEPDEAIARAVDFLGRAQQADGGFANLFWYAGAEPVEAGNVFPAALIAHSLAFVPEARPVREKALDFLAAEASPEGVWQHWARSEARQEFLPPDVDDTACASAALRDSGRPVPDNEALLFANRDARGLFYTWFTLRPRWSGLAHARLVWPQLRHLRTLWPLFTRTTASVGNVDGAVNANALFYLGARPETAAVPPYLLDILRRDAELESDTWYFNRFVIWYFLARALAPGHEEAGRLMRDKLASAEARTPLEMATAQCSRLYWGMEPDEALTSGLLETQLDSGAWPAEHFYHGKDCYWGSEALTTGFALEALGRQRSLR